MTRAPSPIFADFASGPLRHSKYQFFRFCYDTGSFSFPLKNVNSGLHVIANQAFSDFAMTFRQLSGPITSWIGKKRHSKSGIWIFCYESWFLSPVKWARTDNARHSKFAILPFCYDALCFLPSKWAIISPDHRQSLELVHKQIDTKKTNYPIKKRLYCRNTTIIQLYCQFTSESPQFTSQNPRFTRRNSASSPKAAE